MWPQHNLVKTLYRSGRFSRGQSTSSECPHLPADLTATPQTVIITLSPLPLQFAKSGSLAKPPPWLNSIRLRSASSHQLHVTQGHSHPPWSHFKFITTSLEDTFLLPGFQIKFPRPVPRPVLRAQGTPLPTPSLELLHGFPLTGYSCILELQHPLDFHSSTSTKCSSSTI